MLKVLGLKIPKRKATKDKLVNLIISLFHIKLNYNDTSNLLLIPTWMSSRIFPKVYISPWSIPLNGAGSSEMITQRVNYIMDFAARNSFLLDRRVVPVFSWPNLPYLCETCPIKVQSIFSRHYVFYTIAYSCLIKVQSIFSNFHL